MCLRCCYGVEPTSQSNTRTTRAFSTVSVRFYILDDVESPAGSRRGLTLLAPLISDLPSRKRRAGGFLDTVGMRITVTVYFDIISLILV